MDKRAYLRPSSDATLAFLVVPADTLTLARVFYRRTKAVAGVRRLARDPEWRVEHSFHFGFMSTGYAWTTGDIDVDRYLDLWVEAIETAGAVERADWDRYFAWLVRAADRHAEGPTRVRSSLHEQRATDGNAASRDPDRAPVATERGGGSAPIWAVRAAGPSCPRSDRRTPRSLTSRFSPWPSNRWRGYRLTPRASPMESSATASLKHESDRPRDGRLHPPAIDRESGPDRPPS